jgi:antagonist of KipI
LKFPRVLPVGDAAVALEFADALDAATNAGVRSVDRDLARRPFDGFREAVPTHRSLLVLYDPAVTRSSEVARDLRARAEAPAEPLPPGRHHEIPVAYGGEDGPDLASVAAKRGLSEVEAVRLHSQAEYTVFMLGFTPGFPYLGLVPEALECPRRATPRVRVPAGSVAVAARQTGIYPSASPGGWHILGRTSVRMFDPRRDEPALVAPGDRVRFVPVRDLPPPEPPLAPPPRAGTAVLEVLEAGLLTSVQDAGRAGYRRVGVSSAGPMDARAHAAANRAVGNPAEAAALECTVVGPRLAFLSPVRFAVAGADLGAVLERADLGSWPVPLGAGVLARPGNVLRFTGARAGGRAYVALQGGIDVPVVLGSRATDLSSAFGGFSGRALASSDRLAVCAAAAAGLSARESPPELPARSVTVRVVLGPQADHFDEREREAFLGSPWRVSATSDRVGCRLEGLSLRHAGPAEILSDGMVPGSIQVPPDGQPIVMMADGPTTGGYPKIATVVSRDLPLVGQLVPGQGEVRFEAVRIEDL